MRQLQGDHSPRPYRPSAGGRRATTSGHRARLPHPDGRGRASGPGHVEGLPGRSPVHVGLSPGAGPIPRSSGPMCARSAGSTRSTSSSGAIGSASLPMGRPSATSTSTLTSCCAVRAGGPITSRRPVARWSTATPRADGCTAPRRCSRRPARPIGGWSSCCGRSPPRSPDATFRWPGRRTSIWPTPRWCATRITQFYGLPAMIVPPPPGLFGSGPSVPVDLPPGFVLAVSRLVSYKNVDAIRGCRGGLGAARGGRRRGP